MTVSSAFASRAIPFTIPGHNSSEESHGTNSLFSVSDCSSDISASEARSIDDSDSARMPPTFQLLVVTGPGYSRKFVAALETKCQAAGLPVTMIGDGDCSISDDLLGLKIDNSLPAMAIYYAHGDVGSHHTTSVDAKLPDVPTATVLKLLHGAGVARVTVFSCFAGAGADDVRPRHLTDVGGLHASYLFVGSHDDSTSKYVNGDDINGLIDYYCACTQKGTPPADLKEHLLMAYFSPQTLKYVQASPDGSGNPVIVELPGVCSGLADGELRIQNATFQANSKRECKEVRAGLQDEFLEFERANKHSSVIAEGEARMPQRALAQQIYNGDRMEVQGLLARGVKPNWNGHDKLTGLQMATFARDPGILAPVLAHANLRQIDAKAGVSMSPLVIAVGRKARPHVELLLAHNANPNVQSARGTPLMISVDTRSPRITDSLLRHRADPNLSNKFGALPLEVAVHHNSKSMTLRLLKAGARPGAAASHGSGALMVGMGSGKKTGLEKMASYAFWKGEPRIALMLRKLRKRNAMASGTAALPG